MNGPWLNALLLLLTFVVIFGACLVTRRLLGEREVHQEGWAGTLSYVATAYGVVIGFSILFLFGQFAAAKQAVGDEATSIGTAYEQASLFPGSKAAVQRALICYGRAVPTYDWPRMADHQSGAAQVDAAYRDLVVSVGTRDLPPAGALHAATATNLTAQIGNISTARVTRQVAAETNVPPMLWILLLGGGVVVIMSIFVITLPARPGTQAGLVAMAGVFTSAMLLVVFALSDPFAPGAGRVTPRLIEEAVATMTSTAPAAVAAPCDSSADGG